MKTMRAVCIYAYGGPEVLIYEDAPYRRHQGVSRNTLRLLCDLWREVEHLQSEVRFLRGAWDGGRRRSNDPV